jgi:hypothetical protein
LRFPLVVIEWRLLGRIALNVELGRSKTGSHGGDGEHSVPVGSCCHDGRDQITQYVVSHRACVFRSLPQQQ